MALRAGVYTRLSRLKATDELTTLGLERQSEDTLKLCADRGYEVVKHYSDPGVSASDEAVRDQFEQALSDLGDGTIDVLVIPAMDRLTRGLKTWIRIRSVLTASGGKIVSVTDGDLDPTSAIVTIRVALAEDELARIKRRVVRWHQQRASNGHPLVSGRRPFGYVDKQRSAIEPREAAVIEYAAELLIGGKSLRSVTAWANTVTTAPNGKPWRPMNLRQTLLSPGVAGLRYYHDVEVAEGTWEPILDRVTWERLRRRLTRQPSTPGRPAAHLLSGLLRCGRCGQPMHSTTLRDRKRGLPERRQYACRKRPGQPNCGKLTITASPVEELVGAEVLAHLDQGGLTAALASLGDGQAEAAAAELTDAETARNEIEDMLKAREIKRDAFLRLHGPAEARVEAARRALVQDSGRSALADLPTGPGELAAWWSDPETTVADRRAVIGDVLTEVIVMPPTRKLARGIDPERVVIPEEAWKV